MFFFVLAKLGKYVEHEKICCLYVFIYFFKLFQFLANVKFFFFFAVVHHVVLRLTKTSLLCDLLLRFKVIFDSVCYITRI